MRCTRIRIGNVVGIVCTRGERIRTCACGAPMELECDWKTEGGTCSRAICRRCATSPAPGKDLCAPHARAWELHPKNPKNRAALDRVTASQKEMEFGGAVAARPDGLPVTS